MALCDYAPCPAHGLNVPHTNGLCDGCRRERAKVERDDKDAHWNSLDIEGKLDYLRSKIE